MRLNVLSDDPILQQNLTEVVHNYLVKEDKNLQARFRQIEETGMIHRKAKNVTFVDPFIYGKTDQERKANLANPNFAIPTVLLAQITWGPDATFDPTKWADHPDLQKNGVPGDPRRNINSQTGEMENSGLGILPA